MNIDTKDDLKYLEQAKHEFRVGQMLNHPNLVKVYAFETDGGWFSGPKKAKLLLEYVPGRTMDGLPLQRMAKLVRMFERIADGLMPHAQAWSVIHADLKPNNLIYERGTRVKVIDYGLAWIKGEPKDRVQGTPEYMAPETVSHKLINERTDIYNFGATMYRLVTLQLPPCWVAVEGGLPMTSKVFQEQIEKMPVKEANPMVPEEVVRPHPRVPRPERDQAARSRMSQVQGRLDQLADEAAAKLNDPAAARRARRQQDKGRMAAKKAQNAQKKTGREDRRRFTTECKRAQR